MKKTSHIPSTIGGFVVTAVTGANLLLGMEALISVTMGYFTMAAWSLLACVFLDYADGFLARKWGVSSSFGAQLDSLADMTSFVVASAVLCFYWLAPGGSFFWLALAAGLFVLFGAFRLARYNISEFADSEFEGMPTTAVCTLVSLTYLTYPQLSSTWGTIWLLTLGCLMISVLPYPKAAKIVRCPAWVFALFLLGGAINVCWTVWIGAAIYLLSGPVNWVRLRRPGGEASSGPPESDPQ